MTTSSAPPVVYPLGRSRFNGILLLGLWLAGLACAAMWVASMDFPDGRAGLALLAVLASGLAAHGNWKNTPIGELVWDGNTWHWHRNELSQANCINCTVSVIADFQAKLLIRLEKGGSGASWFWAERIDQPDRWLDLRRAIFLPGKPMPVLHSTQAGEPSPVVAAPGTGMPPSHRRDA